jgi:hypothetical protein
VHLVVFLAQVGDFLLKLFIRNPHHDVPRHQATKRWDEAATIHNYVHIHSQGSDMKMAMMCWTRSLAGDNLMGITIEKWPN